MRKYIRKTPSSVRKSVPYLIQLCFEKQKVLTALERKDALMRIMYVFPLPYFTVTLPDKTVFGPERFITYYYHVLKTKGSARRTVQNVLIFFSLFSDIIASADPNEPLLIMKEKYVALIVLTMFLDQTTKNKENVMIQQMILPYLLTLSFTFNVEVISSMITYDREHDIAVFSVTSDDINESEHVSKRYGKVILDPKFKKEGNTLNHIFIFCKNMQQGASTKELENYTGKYSDDLTKSYHSVKRTSKGVVLPSPYEPANVCYKYK